MYTSILVGNLSGTCSFTNISINNATINTSNTNAGIFAGILGGTASQCTISDITINGATISASGARFVGGLVGSFVSTNGTLQIGAASAQNPTEPSVVINDLSINGQDYVGGLLGMAGAIYDQNLTSTTAVGTLIINGVSLDKTGESNCSISAANGYTGGFVGTAAVDPSSVIKNSTIKNTTITNGGTTYTSTAITGGFAGAFMGSISNCSLLNSHVEGAVAAGILARTSSAAGDMAIQGCSVLGDTEIVSTTTSSNSSASGIFGQHNRTNSKKVEITNCSVGSDVEIGGGYFNGGIMGYHHAAANTVTSIVKIRSCRMYADITSGNTGASTTVGTGGIIGSLMPINSFSAADCVVSGAVDGYKYTGGIVGYINCTSTNQFNTATSIDDFVAKYCYLDVKLGSISGATSNLKAKVVGNVPGTSTYCVSNTTINTAFSNIVFSSYPDNVGIGFGTANVQAFANSQSCYIDVNKPYYSSLGEYRLIDGSVSGISLSNSMPQQSISIVNLSNSTQLTGFSYDAAGGWTVIDPTTLAINSSTFDVNGIPTGVTLQLQAMPITVFSSISPQLR
jgi:hypothetical protein